MNAICTLPLLLSPLSPVGTGDALTSPSLHGLEITAVDVEASVHFYVEGLGFEVKSSYPGRGGSVVESGTLVLVIVPRSGRSGSDAPPLTPDSPVSEWGGPYANFIVHDLEKGIERTTQAGGVALGSPRPNAIGRSQPMLDPGGHPLHLMELSAENGGHSGEPAVFNVGFRLDDLEFAEAHWANFGFEISTRAYLPQILPLSRTGFPSLVVHRTSETTVPTGRVLFGTTDLVAGRAWSDELGLSSSSGTVQPRGGPAGRTLAMDEGPWPAGWVERSAARLTFERLRSMVGVWVGSSSKGWEARSEISVLAAGSVVAQKTSFDAHPDDTMLTLFHMDGGRLLLTHYCVAQNQPRLEARTFETDEVEFVWLDATGIASRDEGHMDSCRLSFSESGYTSRWSWYQDGEETWMEEIRYRRPD